MRLFNYGKIMLCADQVTQLADSSAGSKEVTKFMLAIQRSGIPYYMVMYMGLICVRTNNKRIIAL